MQSSGGLSDKDIQRILEEAERNRENDAKQKEVTEVKNHAESVVYDTEKNMKTYLALFVNCHPFFLDSAQIQRHTETRRRH